jgi:HAD superfamily hydrolase (TIGR01509 family)
VKPDPRIFEIALEKSGTAPKDTAYFDDVAAYVEGARELGIRASLFESAASFPAQLRDLGLAH